MNRRYLIALLLLLNLLMWTAARELNDWLAPHRLYLHLEVLLVIFAAFYLKALPGFVLTAVLGFFLGAARPVPVGYTLLSLMALWIAGLWGRRRVRRDHPTQIASFAAVAQACLLLAYSVVLMPPSLHGVGAYWQRVLLETLASAAGVALLALPWCRFQLGIMAGFGWDLENEAAHQ